MKINSVYIDGYKNLVDFNVEFDNNLQSVFIIGNNGSGKTNFIEAIITIFRYIRDLVENNTMPFRKKNKFKFEIKYRIGNNRITVNSEGILKVNDIPVDSVTFNILPKEIVIYNAGDSKRIYEMLSAKELFDNRKMRILNLDYITQKQLVLSHYLSNDHEKEISRVQFFFQQSKVKQIIENNQSSKVNSELVDFFKYFRHSLKLESNKTAELILKRDEFYNFRLNKYIDIFDILRLLVKNDIFSNFTKSRRDYFRIFFRVKDQELEFSEFGEGQQLLMSLTSVLDKFADQETIFLMDEPDAFIHPNNLIRLTDLIKESSSQFLMTTHSPAIVSRLSNSEIILFKSSENNSSDVLEDINPIKYENQYGRKINYLYEDLMQIKSYPTEIQTYIDRINEHIENARFVEARIVLGELEGILGSDDTEVITLYTRLILIEEFRND